ncbi:alanine racemase [Shinella oryzae]|uniref:alanine racemase n=1 Tax=Shinella oryzae TaxID=2871820 RepID=UPI001FF47FA4|nr:alanine racemase [Shinella oryzae]UPA27771.1 alanine racemase [Shinella oryzae]
MTDAATHSTNVFDARFRGIPPGEVLSAASIKSKNWSPARGDMPLPVLTLDTPALRANATGFLDYANEAGVLLAPHAKTPMMPTFAKMLIEQGAWGATVANIQQLQTLLEAGITRLVYASPPGGASGARHLINALKAFPAAEVFIFLDSVEGVAALDAAMRNIGNARVSGLVELGFGRTGARTLETAIAIRDAILATEGQIELAGVATYEAAAVDGSDYRHAFDELFQLVSHAFSAIRDVVGSEKTMTITAGGSMYFDEVVSRLGPIAREGNARLVLRSGAIFFSDDGLYKRALEAVAARGITGQVARSIKPVLSLWTEVLSQPEPDLTICGFGMRDAPNDQGVPIIRRAFRDGQQIDLSDPAPVVEKLNDQHAFVRGSAALRVGDVLELGISHPCTALQRWRLVYGIDEQGLIVDILTTHFG